MRVIKRKKYHKEYYYLQHSLRKGKKIINVEMYLGKKIPRNIKKIQESLLNQYYRKYNYPFFEKIKNNFQKEWKKYPESIKNKIMDQFAIAFTYNTNAIEGSTITLRETEELIKYHLAPNKSIKDIIETENHYKVFRQMLTKKEKFNLSLILKWHKDLFRETKPDIAGKFRKYNVRVGPYIAPDWPRVKTLMNEFIKFYNENKKLNPVELASRMHFRFESIHPFGDGNGRIGRLIMNHILWHSNHPILIIEFNKRKFYYVAFSKGELGFLNYFTRTYLKVFKKYLKS